MQRVLILQQIWDDPPGTLGEMLQEQGIAYDIIHADKEAIPSIDDYTALVVLGGPQQANADDLYPYLAAEKKLIRSAVEHDVPFLGICLGGQLLALTLGAPVTRHHLVEIGFYEVQFTADGQSDPLFAGLPGYEQVIHWHEDTFAIPAGAVSLATSENTPNQAFRFGRRAYGLQYHIEVTPEVFDVWLRHPDYQQEIVKALGSDVPSLIESQRESLYPIYRAHTRQLFHNFLHLSGLL